MTHRRKPRRIETEADRAEIMHAREVKRAEKEMADKARLSAMLDEPALPRQHS